MGKLLTTNNDLKTKRKEVFFKTAKEFAETSTTHGIYYVFTRKYGRISQLFWLMICVALTFIAVVFIWEAYDEWKKSPVITSVKTTG